MNTFISKSVGTEISFVHCHPVDGKNGLASDIELKEASRVMRPKGKLIGADTEIKNAN
jgi:hypothetical protein